MSEGCGRHAPGCTMQRGGKRAEPGGRRQPALVTLAFTPSRSNRLFTSEQSAGAAQQQHGLSKSAVASLGIMPADSVHLADQRSALLVIPGPGSHRGSRFCCTPSPHSQHSSASPAAKGWAREASSVAPCVWKSGSSGSRTGHRSAAAMGLPQSAAQPNTCCMIQSLPSLPLLRVKTEAAQGALASPWR